MSILKDNEEDQRSELSYAEPEVAQDASPAPIPSSAPAEETPAPVTPAPEVPAPVPDPTPSTPFQQPVSYLTFTTEEERQRYFAYRRELHLQRTWQKPQTSLFGAWRHVLDAEDQRQQAEELQAYEDNLADQARDSSPVSEGFFNEGQVGGEDERMVEIEDVTDKAEEPHKVIALVCGSYLLLIGLFQHCDCRPVPTPGRRFTEGLVEKGDEIVPSTSHRAGTSRQVRTMKYALKTLGGNC